MSNSSLFPTYKRWEINAKEASGSWIIDHDNKKYLDFTSGIGVCNLGHRPSNVLEAVEHQLKKYWHLSNLFPQTAQEETAKKLAKGAKLDLVFFTNSGTEANEAAIKLARKATGKTKMISFTQSFHGRTFGAMAATGQEKIHEGFGPMLEQFHYVPFNDTLVLEEVMDEHTAAVILEVVQGEGGVHIANTCFLQSVQQLCKKFSALLIIDEVQTGNGRTGEAFAYHHYGLDPDLITTAKGLGSGFPIGALIGKEKWKDVFSPGSHGSTFGGNPIAIAAAKATIDTIYDEAFLENVKLNGDYLLQQLRLTLQDSTIVKSVRGLGLMIGIELTEPVNDWLTFLREQGLIVLPAGEKVIRLLPPLTVTNEEMDIAISIIEKVLVKSFVK